MTVKRISNQALVEAAASVRMAMLSSLPEPEACGCTFSSEFEKKIEAMRRRAECRNRRKQITHRVAAAIVAVFVGFSLLCALNAEVRAAIRGWIKEVIGDSSYYWFQGEKAEELPYYELTYVPEGYDLVQESRIETYTHDRVYRREGNIRGDFVFGYSLAHEDAQLIVNFNDIPHEVREVQIHGCRGELHISSDLSQEASGLMWVDEEKGVCFVIQAFFEPEEIIKIAESVQIVAE